MIINVPPQARSAPQILNVKNKLMSSRRYIFTFLLSVLSALTLSAQNHNFEVAKNLDIFNTLYRDLDLYYVDTLNAQRNISNAANYMLRMLDPYTEYYPEQDTPSLRQLTTASTLVSAPVHSIVPTSNAASSLAPLPLAQQR